MNRLPVAKRVQILSMLCEGSSMRSISRVVDVSINTVTKLLVDAGEVCARFHDEHVRGVKARRVQVDEIWSFTYAKQKNVETAKAAPEGAGDTWTWTGLDADSKLIVSWLVGPRDAGSAYTFVEDIAARLAGRIQLTSDGLRLYLDAVEAAFWGRCGLQPACEALRGHRRKTRRATVQPRALGAWRRRSTGDPDPKHISTSYVERQKPYDANEYAPVHQTHETGFSKKIRQSRPHGGALHRVLQLDADSQDAADESGAGCWAHRAPVGHVRHRRVGRSGRNRAAQAGKLKLRHYQPTP